MKEYLSLSSLPRFKLPGTNSSKSLGKSKSWRGDLVCTPVEALSHKTTDCNDDGFTEDPHAARIYKPLPLVVTHADNYLMKNAEGEQFLDCVAAYSAINLGHGNKQIMSVVKDQLKKVTVTARIVDNEWMPIITSQLVKAAGMAQHTGKVILMNSGAEAVESAIKSMRKWAYERKQVEADKAIIVVASENFHGRTTTIVSFSSDKSYKASFGPFSPPESFITVPFGDVSALEAAIESSTEGGKHFAGILLEPIQGEGGVNVPPSEYLAAVKELCLKYNGLLCLDEIQTGLGRTGSLMCCPTALKPDLVLFGKSLGGGVIPISACVGSNDIMDLYKPGDHGSTFGGNALACRVATAAVEMLSNPVLLEHVVQAGDQAIDLLRTQLSGVPWVKEIRGRGLLIGIELTESVDPWIDAGFRYHHLVLKACHDKVIRFSPPLTTPLEIIISIVTSLAHLLSLNTMQATELPARRTTEIPLFNK